MFCHIYCIRYPQNQFNYRQSYYKYKFYNFILLQLFNYFNQVLNYFSILALIITQYKMKKIQVNNPMNSFVQNIHGVDVFSPVVLYQCQKMFIAYIIDCLNNNQYALVQSPTGTGKTLSLLCSTLSWALNQQQKNNKKYRIIYTSRTHSQLAQVICQLKRTNFNVKICQLASRDHTCINEDLKQLSGHSKELECRLRTMKKGGSFCKYFHHQQFYEKLPMNGSVLDIEEVVERGKSQQFCPYFYGKNYKDVANLVLMPYNYLLDQRLMRQDIQSLIKDSIIIFDEGHNIPSVCEQSEQFTINLQTMERALNHISQLRELSLKMQSLKQPNKQQNALKSIPAELQLHADYISCLHSHFQTLNLPSDQTGIILSTKQFIQLLQKATENADQGPLINNIKKLYTSSNSLRSDTIFRPYWALQTWLTFINFLSNIYSQYLNNEDTTKTGIQEKAYQFQISYQGSDIKLVLICLDPKICFQKLVKHKPKSIIITSGTLSPLNSWPLQLQTSFAKALALPHILSRQQLNACVITHGPNKIRCNYSYENRENKQIYKEAGQIIYDIASKTSGGILVLFPSYASLQKMKNQLSNNGYLSKIYTKKTIFLQNRNSSEFKSVLNSYFAECKKPKGALFLALARGKISEGLDLSDQKCRALIMVGVPYPAVKDIKVKSKMAYLDRKNQISKTVTGNQWYICETIRCINQSIGRIIRHKNDYGSIYLLDQRFRKTQILSQISSWVKQCIKVYSDYEQLIFKIDLFNKSIKSKQTEQLQAEAFFTSVNGTSLGNFNEYKKQDFSKKYDLSARLEKKQERNSTKIIDPSKQQEKVRESLKTDIDRIAEEHKNWSVQKMIFKGSFNKKLPVNEPPSQKKECPVCRYDRKLIKNSQCQHELCSDCWDIWLKKDLRCPICRIRIREKYLIK